MKCISSQFHIPHKVPKQNSLVYNFSFQKTKTKYPPNLKTSKTKRTSSPFQECQTFKSVRKARKHRAKSATLSHYGFGFFGFLHLFFSVLPFGPWIYELVRVVSETLLFHVSDLLKLTNSQLHCWKMGKQQNALLHTSQNSQNEASQFTIPTVQTIPKRLRSSKHQKGPQTLSRQARADGSKCEQLGACGEAGTGTAAASLSASFSGDLERG